ncbi:Unsaturated rhamnogalacturonyl hydrolase YesR [compost metagenome]
MLRFGLYDGNQACVDEGLKQFDIHINCQFDSACGLFYHGYHCVDEQTLGEHWGRGNGWAAVSLAELLDLLKEQPHQTERYKAVFTQLMENVYSLRLENGMLRTLLDVKEAYPETSASALFAYAALKGHKLGLLDGKYRTWGLQIIGEILARHLAEDGTVLHASGGTDCQEKEGYLKVPYQSRQYTTGVVLMLLTKALEELPQTSE